MDVLDFFAEAFSKLGHECSIVPLKIGGEVLEVRRILRGRGQILAEVANFIRSGELLIKFPKGGFHSSGERFPGSQGLGMLLRGFEKRVIPLKCVTG